ncbi:DUF983 domain-containing protein [Chelatococcus reniformis]|uniref:Membrane protein n=1 Tax=Chelatococcus reniformis TaxID=1494448 RepID=A0A916XDM0_9HYPH|nr:DUF983 domain-containing protein [Chelatococcus reniformis]GGC62885.1 membrane protein [Chelatococcus reniformis]
MNADHYPPQEPVATGLAGRCPRCGQGRLFNGFLSVAPSCGVCGLDFSFADAADGPAFFIMTAAGVAVVGFALWLELTYEPSFWVHLVTTLPLALLLCVLPLRPLKGVMIALQYVNKAEEGRLER